MSPLEDRLAPASFVVTTLADSGAGSLRAQVAAANALAGADTITFDKSLLGGTITLTTGEIAITSDLVIDGPGASLQAVSGNNSSRIFNINGAGTLNVTVQDLLLTKGATSGVNDGGAIFIQDENVTVANCQFFQNTSSSDGGAIRLNAAGAKLTVDDCNFNSNAAAATGGAISAGGSATVTLTDSNITNNSALGGGGLALTAGGDLTVLGCTFQGNSAASGSGGGAFISSSFTGAKFSNSTLHNNSASVNGGGVALGVGFAGSPVFNNCTLTQNSAGIGDGGGIARLGGTSTITLTSSIVFDNTAGGSGPDLFSGGTVKANVCLIESKAGVTTFSGDTFTNANIGADPLLNPLSLNGGPTSTRLPGIGSPAIDAGSNPDGVVNDQRGPGYFRVRGPAADIGAVETPDDFVVTNLNNAGAGSLRQAILDANTAVGDDTIVFSGAIFGAKQSIGLSTGELLISDDLVIDGPAAGIIINGNADTRVFNIFSGSAALSVTIEDVTITNGKLLGTAEGAGILVNGENLTLSRCSVIGNHTDDEGGGIRLVGTGATLVLSECTVAGNSAALSGGGIAAGTGTVVTIFSSTLSGNSAVAGGGAVAMLGSGTFTLRNSTVSGNTADVGGGVRFTATATSNSFGNSTIVNNTATGGSGGGISSLATTLNIESTIVSDNVGAAAPDVAHAGTTNLNASAVKSLTGFTPTGTGNLIGLDLKLGPLSVGVHAPALNSPVLGKGSNVFGLATDQRGSGFPRLRGAGVDIGAVEVLQLLVSNTLPSGAGSFAQAVADSNNFGGSDTITFDPTVFATNKVINLAGTLALNTGMEIQGPAASVTLSGQGANRIFTMANGITYTFSNIDLLLGKGTTDGGAMSVNQANAKLTFTNCTFGFNTTTTEGGVLGLSAASTNSVVTFTDCSFTNNNTTGLTQDGGAIRSDAAITLNLVRTTLANNDATGDGGAVSLAAGSSLLVQDSTLSGNEAGLTGGAIALNGAPGAGGLKVINSTLSGNKSAQDGGGLSWTSSSGTLAVQNSTVTNNTSSAGGGGGLSVTTGTGNLSIESSIVSGNFNAGAPDIDNPNTTTVKTSAIGDNLGFVLTSAGGNLTFQPHANLKLGALADNGGPTLTHLPAIGSPLVNAGLNPAGLVNDQRGPGFARSKGPGTDIGAIEARLFYVENTNDAGPGSLRQAVTDANALDGPDTIEFNPAVFSAPQTITLTTGQVIITDGVTITGSAAGVTVSGNNNSRIFLIVGSGGSVVTLDGLTLTAAKSAGAGGSVRSDSGTLRILNSTITGNVAQAVGGVTHYDGNLEIRDSTFSNNTATGGGAGGLSLVNLSVGGSLLVEGCLVAGNTANFGGGMTVLGTEVTSAVIRNSTLTGNVSKSAGGAIECEIVVSLVVQNCTITGNTAATGGGGIFNNDVNAVSIDSTIIFGNTALSGPDLFTAGTATVKSSLIGTKSGVTTFVADSFTIANIGVDPQLGPLQDNGGLSFTMLPALTSKAVNNGSNTAALVFDQRGPGFPRSIGLTDIGAAETRALVVTTTADAGEGSLRDIIAEANALAGPDTITFDPAVFGTAKTISLLTALPTVSDDAEITGPGADLLTVRRDAGAAATFRVFTFANPGANLVSRLSGMTISGGDTTGRGGGVYLGATDALTLDGVIISGNRSTFDGGGLAGGTSSTLTLVNCTVAGNTSAQSGGGIHHNSGTLVIDNSTLSGNSAIANGGGLFVSNPASASRVRNSTVSGNAAAASGGGIANAASGSSSLVVQNSTITANTAGSGGGLAGLTPASGFDLLSTIVAGNTAVAGADISTTAVVKAGTSLIGDPAGFALTDLGGNVPFGTEPRLGPLADNGGPTFTHLPRHDSPVVNKGANPLALTSDQRGFARSQNGGVDIGAAEAPTPFIVINANDSGPGSLRQAVATANATPGSDIILFDPTFFATAKTITAALGRMDVLEGLEIAGPAGALTLDGNKTNGIFEAGNAPADPDRDLFPLLLSDLTFTKGTSGNGGAIFASGVVEVDRCTFSGNISSFAGGAIHVAGSLTVRDSSFSNNTAGFGGGIAVIGSLAVERSLISGNTTAGSGGGILHEVDPGRYGTSLTIRNSTITGNSSGAAGGGVMQFNGGGVLVIQNCTIVFNTGSTGGGIHTTLGAPASIAIESSVVANNFGGTAPDVASTTVSVKNSAIGSAAGFTLNDLGGNLPFGIDVKLGPLSDSGGPTRTHVPLPGSPLLNAGSNPSGAATDQRGFARVSGPAADIGAVEIQGTKVSSVVVNNGVSQRSRVTSVKVTFDTIVTFTGAPELAFKLARQGDNALVNLAAASDNSGPGTAVTLTFVGGAVNSGSLADGRYTLTVHASNVNSGGLDGNNDGTSGDNFVLVGDPAVAPKLFRLFGDNDGDGDVDAADFGAFRAAFGSTTNLAFDFDGDGDVDASDFGAFRQRFGTSV